jgi:hypothetical protein
VVGGLGESSPTGRLGFCHCLAISCALTPATASLSRKTALPRCLDRLLPLKTPATASLSPSHAAHSVCLCAWSRVCVWLGVCAVARPCQESVDVLSTVMASVYVVVDVQVSGGVDLKGLRIDELRGTWASALRLPSSNVLILSVSETGRAVRVAVRVDKGQTTDKVFAHIQQTAQSSAALRPLEVPPSTRTT